MLKNVDIDKIVLDDYIQPREKIDWGVVDKYASVYLDNPKSMPSIVLFEGSQDRYWLADGFHRYWARRKLNCTDVWATVKEGGKLEALRYSLKVNADERKKGSVQFRRTDADRDKALMKLYLDEELNKLPDSKISRLCGVSEQYLKEARERLKLPNAIPNNMVVSVTKAKKIKTKRSKKHDYTLQDLFKQIMQNANFDTKNACIVNETKKYNMYVYGKIRTIHVILYACLNNWNMNCLNSYPQELIWSHKICNTAFCINPKHLRAYDSVNYPKNKTIYDLMKEVNMIVDLKEQQSKDPFVVKIDVKEAPHNTDKLANTNQVLINDKQTLVTEIVESCLHAVWEEFASEMKEDNGKLVVIAKECMLWIGAVGYRGEPILDYVCGHSGVEYEIRPLIAKHSKHNLLIEPTCKNIRCLNKSHFLKKENSAN